MNTIKLISEVLTGFWDFFSIYFLFCLILGILSGITEKRKAIIYCGILAAIVMLRVLPAP